jgi:hypothetical protein
MLEGLVRPVGVVLGAERVHCGLRRLQVRPDLDIVEQSPLQTLGRVGHAARCLIQVLFRVASLPAFRSFMSI